MVSLNTSRGDGHEIIIYLNYGLRRFTERIIIAGLYVLIEFRNSFVYLFASLIDVLAVLGAVLRLEAVELDLVAFHIVSDLHPKLVLGGQKVERRHQGEVLLVELADSLNKGQSVFFVSEVHIEFLTFSDELIEPSAKGGVVDVLHCLSHDLGSACCSGSNPFLNAWALADCAFSFSVVVEAQAAVAHLCRVFKTTQNHYAAASWGKALYLSHHSLEGYLTR